MNRFELFSIKHTDVVTAMKNISVMLKAGLTIPEALDVLSEQTSGAFSKVIKQLLQSVQNGFSLAESMKAFPGVFSAVVISSVKIGESSGTLSENLLHIAEEMEHDLTIRRNIQSAMIYPVMILCGAIVLSFVLAMFVLPQLANVFRSLNSDLPASTKFLMWIADTFSKYGIYIIISTILFFVMAVFIIRQPFSYPVTHRFLTFMPPFSLFVREANCARFCRSLGTMIQSGVPLQEAVEICASGFKNILYQRSIYQCALRLETGEQLSQTMKLHPKLFPSMLQRMVAVGERSGGLGISLLFLAKFYEEKVELRAKGLSTIIEPLMLIAIGGVVAFLAVSIFTPIYSITQATGL